VMPTPSSTGQATNNLGEWLMPKASITPRMAVTVNSALNAAQSAGSTAWNAAKSVGQTVVNTAQTAGRSVLNTAQTAGRSVMRAAQTLGQGVVKTVGGLGRSLWNTARSAGQAAWTSAKNLGARAVATGRSLGSRALSGAARLGSAAWTTTRDTAGRIVGTVSRLGSAAGQKVAGVAGRAFQTAESLGGRAVDFAHTIANHLSGSSLCKAAGAFALKGYNAVKGVVSHAWNTTKQWGGKAVNVAKSVGSRLWQTASGLGSRAWAGAKNTVSRISATVKNLGQSAWSTAKRLGQSAWTTAKSLGTRAWTTAQSVGKGVLNTAKTLGQTAWNTAKTAGKAVWNTAKSMGQTALNAAKTAGQAVWNKASSAASALYGLANRLTGGAVSKVTGMAQAILGKAAGVLSFVMGIARSLASSAINAARSWVSKALSTAQRLGRQAISAATGLAQKAAAAAGRLAQQAWTTAQRLATQAAATAKRLATSAATAARTVVTKAISTAKSLAGRAWSTAKSLAGQAWSTAKSLAGRAWTTVKGWGGKVVSVAKAVGGKVVGIAKTIGGKVIGVAKTLGVDKAWHAVQSLGSKAISIVKEAGAALKNRFGRLAAVAAKAVNLASYLLPERLAMTAAGLACRTLGCAVSTIVKQGGNTSTQAADFSTDVIPVVSTVKSTCTALNGVNPITGKKVTTAERLAALASAGIDVVSYLAAPETFGGSLLADAEARAALKLIATRGKYAMTGYDLLTAGPLAVLEKKVGGAIVKKVIDQVAEKFFKKEAVKIGEKELEKGAVKAGEKVVEHGAVKAGEKAVAHDAVKAGPTADDLAYKKWQSFDGAKDAAAALQKAAVPRPFRTQVMESFDIRTMRVRTAGPDEYGSRYYDGVDAKPSGRYLFETFPASRESLALLPQWNKMTGIQQWKIRPGALIIEGQTSPQGRFGGGQVQKYILNPETDLINPAVEKFLKKESVKVGEKMVENGVVKAGEKGAAKVRATAPTPDGAHTIKVTPSGRVVRCSTCTELRAQYPQVLANRSDLHNRLLVIEQKALDPARAAEAAQEAAIIETEMRQITEGMQDLHPGKQGKHVLGHNNFQPGKSELTYPDPAGLLRRFGGTGTPVRGVYGSLDYRERVDFGAVIGTYVDPVSGARLPTTKGIIHHSTTGAHIVPARP